MSGWKPTGTGGGGAGDVTVAKEGTEVGTRGRINLIPGAGIDLTVTDDAGGDEIDVTVANVAAGSSIRGQASIANPATEVTVNHNLGTTPAPGTLQVSPSTQDAAESDWWLDDFTTLSFKIKVAATPTGTAFYDWLYVAASAPGGGFDPESISGLRVWLDASQLTGLADTDPVQTWPNLIAAEAENFTQATLANRPLYRTAVQNGLPGVRFDGSNDFLSGTVSRPAKPRTMFLAGSLSSVAGFRYALGNVSNAAVVTAHNGTQLRLDHEDSAIIGVATTALATGPFMYDVSYADDGAFVFGRNGSDDGAGTNNRTPNASALRLGYRDSSSLLVYAGDMFEILVYDSVLSGTDRQNVRDYLMDKWAI